MQNSEPQCFILVRGPFHVKRRACLLNASLGSELCGECLFVRTTECLFRLFVERCHLCWKYIWKTWSGTCSSAVLTASLFYEICARWQIPPHSHRKYLVQKVTENILQAAEPAEMPQKELPVVEVSTILHEKDEMEPYFLGGKVTALLCKIWESSLRGKLFLQKRVLEEAVSSASGNSNSFHTPQTSSNLGTFLNIFLAPWFHCNFIKRLFVS